MTTLYSRETPKLLRGMRDKLNVTVGDHACRMCPSWCGEDEDEGPHEDLNEHEMSKEASDSDEGQQEFDESSDEVSADDNNSQGQQDELGTSTNFLFGATSRCGRAVLGVPYKKRRDARRLAWRCKFRILVSLRVFWAKCNHM